MTHRKSKLELTHRDLAVTADIRTRKLRPDPVDGRTEIVHRDATTGSQVVRRAYDEVTGESLEERSSYRWVDEAGEEVPPADVEAHVVTDDAERAAPCHEPTIGEGRTLEALRWIPVAEVDECLIDEVHEIEGVTDVDVAELYELAAHVREVDQAPVIPVVLRPSYHRDLGVITPTFFDGTFSLLLRVTSRRIEPEARMPALEADAVDGSDRNAERYGTLDRESSPG